MAQYALITYGQTEAATEYVEVYRVVDGKLVDPTPMTHEMLQALLPKVKKEDRRRDLGILPPACRYIDHKQMTWKPHSRKVNIRFKRFIKGRQRITTHLVDTSRHLLRWQFNDKSLYAFYDAGPRGLYAMPLPNVNSMGNVCLGNMPRLQYEHPQELADKLENWFYTESFFTENHQSDELIDAYLNTERESRFLLQLPKLAKPIKP